MMRWGAREHQRHLPHSRTTGVVRSMLGRGKDGMETWAESDYGQDRAAVPAEGWRRKGGAIVPQSAASGGSKGVPREKGR